MEACKYRMIVPKPQLEAWGRRHPLLPHPHTQCAITMALDHDDTPGSLR